MAQGHDPVDPVGGDNPTKSQIKQSWQDWANVHDRALFHAPVAPGQLALWQHVRGLINNDEAIELAQCLAITPLAEQIQLPDEGAATVSPAGSERDTWMQAYT